MKNNHWLRSLCNVVVILNLTACAASSPVLTSMNDGPRSEVVNLESQKREIDKIRVKFSCDLARHVDILNYISAYLRESNFYDINVLDNRAYRNMIERDMMVADKYISPKYLRAHYISPQTSIIQDVYGNSRPPEILCIKEAVGEKYEAYILTYWHKKMDYAVVDKISISIEGGEKFLVPPAGPKSTSADASSFYARIGVAKIPASEIRVIEKVFNQRSK